MTTAPGSPTSETSGSSPEAGPTAPRASSIPSTETVALTWLPSGCASVAKTMRPESCRFADITRFFGMT